MSKLYFLPGRGSSFNGRLGVELQSRGYELHGRVLDGDFAKLSFFDQVTAIASDLVKWNAPVVAHSWGAYWFLHAVLLNKGCESRALLISPLTGSVRGQGRLFKPPQSRYLEHTLTASEFPQFNLSVLVGGADWQSPVERCEALCSAAKGDLFVLDGKGHDLGRDGVVNILDSWLPGSI